MHDRTVELKPIDTYACLATRYDHTADLNHSSRLRPKAGFLAFFGRLAVMAARGKRLCNLRGKGKAGCKYAVLHLA